MPVLHDYKCQFCGRIEELCHPMEACPATVPCMTCKMGHMVRQMSAPSIRTDENATWLDEAARNASNDHRHGRKKITTRAGYKQYLADNGLRELSDGPNLAEV